MNTRKRTAIKSIFVVWAVVALCVAEYARPQGNRTNSRQIEAPAQEGKLGEQTSVERLAQQQKMVRDAYVRLMRYHTAARDEQAATSDVSFKPEDYVVFELRDMHTGPIEEIPTRPLAELVTGATGEVLKVTPHHLQYGKGPKHAYYDVEWSSGSSSTLIETRDVREFAASAGDMLADVDRYTSYEVTVRLAGNERTYRAIALHHAKLDSSGKVKTEIVDNITTEINAVLADESPRVRSPWKTYVKSGLYLAVVKEIRKAERAGRPLIAPDAPLGYLPGDDVKSDAADAQVTATAICASTIQLKKLTFKTDHALIRNNTADYTSNGSVYTKPDWVDTGNINPVSHTMNLNVGVELELLVSPADASSQAYSLTGTGPTGLNFQGTVTLSGGTNITAITSNVKLESKVQKLVGSISWVLSKDSQTVMTKSTGPHIIYVTMGTPRNDSISINAVTQKRMERSVQQVSAANSLDPHMIVKTVIQAQGNFILGRDQENEWLVPDSGGDCQSIVRFTAAVLNMINVPGTVVHKNVYAIETNPTQGIEADPPGGLNNPIRFHPNGIWRLYLIDGSTHADGSSGCNAFEATAKFTYNNVTKYYAGGTTGVFDNPNQVLTVFVSLSWVEIVTTGTESRCFVRQVIHTY